MSLMDKLGFEEFASIKNDFACLILTASMLNPHELCQVWWSLSDAFVILDFQLGVLAFRSGFGVMKTVKSYLRPVNLYLTSIF